MSGKINFKNYCQLIEAQHIELLAIRNMQHIRDVSLGSKAIELQEHLDWLSSIEKSGSTRYLAVLDSDQILGGVNYRIKNACAMIGLFFKPKLNPIIGSGAAILLLDELLLSKGLKEVHAEVKEHNKAAIALNKSLGYDQVSSKDGVLLMKLTRPKWQEMTDNFGLKLLRKKMKKMDYSFGE